MTKELFGKLLRVVLGTVKTVNPPGSLLEAMSHTLRVKTQSDTL